MMLQFLLCMLATLSFGVLFAVPKSELIFCGLTGALGWLVYLICLNADCGAAISNLIATFTLTVVSRTTAALRKNPVTVYLISGIFPLVPGAGIYYTSYYFIMNEMEKCTANGMNTAKVAGAIVLGIIFGFSLPQSWFHAISHKKQTS
ncbi:MAG: threonine/serine exporter family protein [Roseburia sp.]